MNTIKTTTNVITNKSEYITVDGHGQCIGIRARRVSEFAKDEVTYIDITWATDHRNDGTIKVVDVTVIGDGVTYRNIIDSETIIEADNIIVRGHCDRGEIEATINIVDSEKCNALIDRVKSIVIGD